MEREIFTFVACTPFGYKLEQCHLTRSDADKHFDELIEKTEGVEYVTYYCSSVGGQVNAWHCG